MTSPSTTNSIDVSSIAFGPVVSAGDRVSVPLESAPLRVVTKKTVLANSPLDGDGNVNPFVSIKLATVSDKKFFDAFEKRVLAEAVASKAEWFGETVDADHVTSSFKSFVKDGALKVRVSSDTSSFDEAGDSADIASFFAGDEVRALLEATAVRLGRSEFGIVWALRQLRKESKAVCYIELDPASEDADGDWDMIV